MVPAVTAPKNIPIVSPAPVLGSVVTVVTAGTVGGGVGGAAGGAAAGTTGVATAVQVGAVTGWPLGLVKCSTALAVNVPDVA